MSGSSSPYRPKSRIAARAPRDCSAMMTASSSRLRLGLASSTRAAMSRASSIEFDPALARRNSRRERELEQMPNDAMDLAVQFAPFGEAQTLDLLSHVLPIYRLIGDRLIAAGTRIGSVAGGGAQRLGLRFGPGEEILVIEKRRVFHARSQNGLRDRMAASYRLVNLTSPVGSASRRSGSATRSTGGRGENRRMPTPPPPGSASAQAAGPAGRSAAGPNPASPAPAS